MNILHVISSLDPALGGTAACVREVASSMSQRGHNVNVASLSDSPNDPWIRDFPVLCTCLSPSLLKYSAAPRLLWWLSRHVGRFDVIIINGLWQFQGLSTALVSWLRRRPYIIYVHGMLGPLGKVSAWKYFKKMVYWILVEYWVLRSAAFAVFTSEEEARLARGFFPFYRWKEAVVGNGVSLPQTVGPESTTRLLNRFPELAGKSLVLCLGRLHPGKGCDILLKAFAAEFVSDPQYHVVFVGPDSDPPYGSALRQLASTLLIADKVTWTGMLTGEDREAMFVMSTLFVSPSHHENFGIAVIEAVARGIPSIVTNKVNTHTILSSGGAAIVCDDTVEGVRGALRKWLSMSEHEKASMRDRQRSLYQQMFTPERTAETLERTLLEAVSGRQQQRSAGAR